MFFFTSYIITCVYITSLMLSINNQYFTVLLDLGDLPRFIGPWCHQSIQVISLISRIRGDYRH